MDEDGVTHPCAYFSKKNTPAECNYPIYDKELLAVVRCMEAWDAELRLVEKFMVITDYKNLEYFFQPRRLSERHIRWLALLDRFNFEFVYRKGSENVLADTLSRREQDMPKEDNSRASPTAYSNDTFSIGVRTRGRSPASVPRRSTMGRSVESGRSIPTSPKGHTRGGKEVLSTIGIKSVDIGVRGRFGRLPAFPREEVGSSL